MDTNNDKEFYPQFAACVSGSELQVDELFALLKSPDAGLELGEASALVAAGNLEAGAVAVRRAYQSATGSREAALFALLNMLPLLQCAKGGKVIFSELPAKLLHHRVDLFEFLNTITPGKFSLQLLATLEVEANCVSETSRTRFGTRGPNRIADLLHTSEADQALAVELLDRAHAANTSCYDNCYADLLMVQARCNDAELGRRLNSAAEYIEKQNPSVLLPDALAAVVSAVQSGQDPGDVLRAQQGALGFRDKDMTSLVLAAADKLCEMGDEESAIGVISTAGSWIGSNAKAAAWAGLVLGDKRNTARAFFRYGLELTGNPFFNRIERSHAVELASRLMFETQSAVTRQELVSQVEAYTASGFQLQAARIREWIAAFDGFASYVGTSLAELGHPMEDPDELRMSQRRIAKWHYLRAIEGKSADEIRSGIAWFEKSCVGNDAPWIQGERLLLSIAESTGEFFDGSMKAKEAQLHKIEGDLLRASQLIGSHYPVAISLALRGLVKRIRGNPECIKDLSMAARMLEPSTPEIARLRELVDAARWDATLQFTQGSEPTLSPWDVWDGILKVLPLVALVADNENRIKQHFAPYREIQWNRARENQVEIVRSLSDPNKRGKALEELLVKIIESSQGLRVLDVRHKNTYEEIDIIVACTKDDPLVSYWGPVFIVECKNWNNKVGTEPVRAFYTKLTTKKGAVRLGVIVATSGFTKGVQELARLFQDALVVTVTLDDLIPAVNGSSSFDRILRDAIPLALFS